MEINIFNITELQQRKEPKKQQGFEIKIYQRRNVDAEAEAEADVEKKVLHVEHKVVFKDKRKAASNLVDRELILKRLKMVLPVEKRIITQSTLPIHSPIKKKPEYEYDLQQELDTIRQIEQRESEEKDNNIRELDEDAFIPLVPFVEETRKPDIKKGRKEEQGQEEQGQEEQGQEEQEEGQDKKGVNGKKGQKKAKVADFVAEAPIDLSIAKIGKSLIADRLPKKQRLKLGVSSYYMNNRKLFINQLSKMFKPYRDKIAENAGQISCKSARNDSIDFELLSHQLVVRDYLNLYTPYRGLLLYHGLGSGKTCTSIGIAEGMKTNKSVVLMTPASLKMNFFSELKKCGDVLYKKNQFWEFISIKGEPQNTGILHQSLGLSREYIMDHHGAWMVDITKASNFAQLSDSDQKAVDDQLNAMIRNKYQDINYNGLNANKMLELTNDGKKNPFDHKVVIIDEAHNLVSRIANAASKKNSIASQLYNYLMDATDVKIVFLTGTPIINTPREIGILFNMLRGYIKTWTFQLQINTAAKINRDAILEYFRDAKLSTYDFVDYSGDKLTITRNPFGFVNKYELDKKRGTKGGYKKGGSKKGVKKTSKSKKSNISKRRTKKQPIQDIDDNEEIYDDEELKEQSNIDQQYNKVNQLDFYEGGSSSFDDYTGVALDEMGNISDGEFQKQVIRALEKNNISVIGKPKVVKELALPDDQDVFNELFINDKKGELMNIDLLKRRILGLTSYFRSAQEQLLPSFVKDADGSNYHTINIDMSSHQFELYKDIRKDERDDEARKRKAKAKKKGQETDEESKFTSTYRIYSRSACNFAFPLEHPRPMLRVAEGEEVDIDEFNGISEVAAKGADDYFEESETNKDKAKNKNVIKEVALTKDVALAKDGVEGQDDEPKMRTLNQSEYQEKIKDAYHFLSYQKRDREYLIERELVKYSPKFARILENIIDEKNIGLHLLYSQFRTLEGIGIFKLVLEANGFLEFKISKKGGEWQIENADVDPEKPRFVLYTGTETAEEKEIIRNIYNSAWEFVPPSIVSVLKEKSENNFLGEIIKVLMITSSGAEGINLRNTRFVHIMEPYWNMVRVDQVVGRARRICSHEDLPEELRTVQVFIYISRITQDQLGKNIEMRINDISKLEYPVLQKTGTAKMEQIPFSTDQYLFEIAQIKDSINRQILTAVKESAIDCSLYNTNPDEPLVCYGFGKVSSNNFGSYPILEVDRSQKPEINVRTEKQVLVGVTVDGIKYAMDKRTKIVYDFESYKKAKDKTGELIAVGTLDQRTQTILFDK
jgi:hypothetical protein